MPSSRNGPPAGLRRRPQKSELIRSEGCQSGPLSKSTTFLPALASTAAYVEPDAPAPTMTTSTFSCVAISPAPLRLDVGHLARHGAVHDVDRVAAQDEIDEPAGRALPTVDLVLPHLVDEVVLRGGVELGERLCALCRARAP